LSTPRGRAPKDNAPAGAPPDGEKPTDAALPHERDEAGSMTGGVPSPRVKQGHDDLRRGVQDTSRGSEADAAYRKLKK
jgi:hypothetical protein